jgi:hypothetical protein
VTALSLAILLDYANWIICLVALWFCYMCTFKGRPFSQFNSICTIQGVVTFYHLVCFCTSYVNSMASIQFTKFWIWGCIETKYFFFCFQGKHTIIKSYNFLFHTNCTLLHRNNEKKEQRIFNHFFLQFLHYWRASHR